MSLAVKIEDLSKRYRLGVINRDMLYKDLQSRWAKLRGKPDPNAPITHIHQSRIEKGDEFWALRNIDLEIRQGEILGLIGRNGAGKSTILKILSRITAPTEGCIKVKGRIASLLEVGTGFHPELTGRENIFLNGAILGMSRSEIRSQFDEIVAFSGIESFIDTPVKRYSSGMYVRLGFAVAAHLQPEILIVDEVLAVGDAEFQKKCLGKMKSVSDSGRTVIFVSHNMSSIRNLCSSCALLLEGRVVNQGNAASVIDTYLSSLTRESEAENKISSFDGSFSILKTILRNQDGETTRTFRAGEGVTVEIHYEAKKPIPNPYIWVTLNNMNGPLFNANMMLDGFRPKILSGRGFVKVAFAPAALLPNAVYSVRGGMRYEDATTFIIPSSDLTHFNVSGSASDFHMLSPVAESILPQARGMVGNYTWETSNGDSYGYKFPITTA